MSTSSDAYIFCEDLFKIYKIADLEVVALRGLDLVVNRGEGVAIVGASGIAAVERPISVSPDSISIEVSPNSAIMNLEALAGSACYAEA